MAEPIINVVDGDQNAIHGESVDGRGVVGKSQNNYGMRAHSANLAGLRASSDESRGLEGWSTKAEGVHGISETGNGVWGLSQSGVGVLGTSQTGAGVFGESTTNEGVHGVSHSPMAGVAGINTANGSGVYGRSDNNVGVWGISTNFEGVHAETSSLNTAAVAAFNLNPNGEGAAIFAKKEGNKGHAGAFVGNVWISGNLTVDKDIILTNADFAEDFDIAAESEAEPGTVMVLDDESTLRESFQPYDKRVAGVISGAGSYKPGIVLDKQPEPGNRKPIALLGKVFCKVDAQYGAVGVGDLLTTSPTPGYAMRASDPLQAFGAVIGKALRPLKEGKGLVPILISLQ